MPDSLIQQQSALGKLHEKSNNSATSKNNDLPFKDVNARSIFHRKAFERDNDIARLGGTRLPGRRGRLTAEK